MQQIAPNLTAQNNKCLLPHTGEDGELEEAYMGGSGS